MGYDIHITRKQDWFDEDGDEISLDEWKSYITADDEMRHDGYAEAETKSGTIRIESDGLAVWTGWSKDNQDGGMAWIYHSGGNLVCKNPDEEILRKMYRIAMDLNAKVQGDECEVYDADGQSNWQELRRQDEVSSLEPAPKKWWQFWK